MKQKRAVIIVFIDSFESLCKSHNVAPSKVAIECGFSKASVTKWRQNRTTPKQEILLKIAEYFGVSVDYLLGNTDVQSPDRGRPTDADLKFALFGGDARYISDEAFEDVRRFAAIVAEKERQKANGDSK